MRLNLFFGLFGIDVVMFTYCILVVKPSYFPLLVSCEDVSATTVRHIDK